MSEFKNKMLQIRFWLGLCPRPRWGSDRPDPLAKLGGLLLREVKGRGKGGEDRGEEIREKEVKGKVRRGKGRGGEELAPVQPLVSKFCLRPLSLDAMRCAITNLLHPRETRVDRTLMSMSIKY